MTPPPASPPDAAGVRAAATRLAGKAIVTPLLENAELNRLVGGRVLLKAETLQHCGSFKFRGAYNLIAQLDEATRRRGVVAWSSGNHAQGVALAARMFGAPATIVMPNDAPRAKTDAVRALGAEIVGFDRYTEDREAIARPIAEARGAAIAPSYDHPHIIEGQGTLALEAAAQAAALGATLDAFVACCGGGGLAAGSAIALEMVSPQTEIHIAEPEGYDETWASIRAGRRLTADISRPTLCDAIATPSPGVLTFPILQRRVAGGASLTEAEVIAAVRFAALTLKLTVEPGGAVALAAVLAGMVRAAGRTVAVTLSGGNLDPATLARCLTA